MIQWVDVSDVECVAKPYAFNFRWTISNLWLGKNRDSLWMEIRFFIYTNWEEISKEEAYLINPYLKEWKTDNPHFFRCKLLNQMLNTCAIHHSKKPRVCSGYPWYGSPTPYDTTFYSPNCGFAKDVS